MIKETFDKLFYFWLGFCLAWYYFGHITFFKIFIIYLFGVVVSFFISMISAIFDEEFK